jgi:hypothetical protein
MKKERRLFPWVCIFCCFIFIVLYITTVKSSPIEKGLPKRGYILDREGNPLVISRDHYRAYLLIKGKAMIGDDLSPVVRKYLAQGVNLPKKGVFLLSDSLTQEEAELLKRENNVFVEWSLERKVIYPGLEALVGKVRNQEGVAGLEKVFDDSLKQGKSIQVSLSLDTIKRISNLGKKAKDLEEILVVKRNGELLGFYSLFTTPFFEKPFLLPPSLLPSYEFSTFEWELGKQEVERDGEYLRITPLHLLQAELRRINGEKTRLTVLPRFGAEEASMKSSDFFSQEEKEEILVLPSQEKSIHLITGKERIILVVRNGLEPRNLLPLFKDSGLLK